MNSDKTRQAGFKLKTAPQIVISFLLILFFAGGSLWAQETETPKEKPVRSTFNSSWLIDNQSVMVPMKGTFQFDIIHRFGTLGNGYSDLFGLYASSNMKLGFNYSPINNLSLGFGLTKRKHLLDFNAKYALLQQTRSGSIPISVTYFGNMVIDSRKEEARDKIYNASDRLSYFHQVLVARKFSERISLQIGGSLSHYNMIREDMKNDHFAISGGGKIGIGGTTSAIFNIDQPITAHPSNNPNPNISLGIELATSSHAFQIFVSNYSSIIPQENNVWNSNNYMPDTDAGENLFDNFLLGFNITRLWNW